MEKAIALTRLGLNNEYHILAPSSMSMCARHENVLSLQVDFAALVMHVDQAVTRFWRDAMQAEYLHQLRCPKSYNLKRKGQAILCKSSDRV